MEELRAILKLWKEVEEDGDEAVLATVVKVHGSAYRRPGARMLIAPGGRRAGSISGGCLEGDLVKKALWWTKDGNSVIKRYATGSGDDSSADIGPGCNGVIDLLLERVGTSKGANARRLILECRSYREPGLIATVIKSEGSANVKVGSRVMLFPGGTWETDIACGSLTAAIHQDLKTVADGQHPTYIEYRQSDYRVEVFFELITPPLHLFIFGTGSDAVLLASLATGLGWDPTVVDSRADYTAVNRFNVTGATVIRPFDEQLTGVPLEADSMAVLMTHSYERDRRLLRTLLHRPLRYLGVLGPKERMRRLLVDVTGDEGTRIEHFPTLYSPAGLDTGSDSPAANALAIAAEIQSVSAGRFGGMLRDRQGPIHDNSQQNDTFIPNETLFEPFHNPDKDLSSQFGAN